jgi:hypothetical protein
MIGTLSSLEMPKGKVWFRHQTFKLPFGFFNENKKILTEKTKMDVGVRDAHTFVLMFVFQHF